MRCNVFAWKRQVLEKRKQLEGAEKAAIDKTIIQSCYSCKHAYLMQSSSHNPIVCECQINKERFVANNKQSCFNKHFKKTNATDVVIHPMIKAPLC